MNPNIYTPQSKADINACNCGKYAPSLEHANTCPRKSSFLKAAGPSRTISEIEERFLAFGYGPTVTIPGIFRGPDSLHEMMQCSCGHWFPRWEYYRCPKCDAPH